MKNASCLIILLSLFILQSCSGLRLSVDLSVNTDRKALELLQNRTDSINSLKASLSIKPAEIIIPAIDAYLDYKKNDTFRLVGLSPNGFTLFEVKIDENQNNVIPVSIKGLDSLFHGNDMLSPEIFREVMDFYGYDRSQDFTYFVEEMKYYYVINQLRSAEGISYPLRRWWIDRRGMVIVRKELFSDLPDKQGVKIFEAVYRNFKDADGIRTSFEVIINDSNGDKIGKIRFNKIEYNTVSRQ
ncbi:MAG: hypothetical protein AABY41_06735 [Nitrospirota bacterium]